MNNKDFSKKTRFVYIFLLFFKILHYRFLYYNNSSVAIAKYKEIFFNLKKKSFNIYKFISNYNKKENLKKKFL